MKKVLNFNNFVNESESDQEYKYKIGDKVTFMGGDGMMSLDTVYDVWDEEAGQYVELDQNEIVLSPKKQKDVGLKLRN
jgi:hypothetical protein